MYVTRKMTQKAENGKYYFGQINQIFKCGPLNFLELMIPHHVIMFKHYHVNKYSQSLNLLA